MVVKGVGHAINLHRGAAAVYARVLGWLGRSL
jgi:hypothetical protein